MFDALVDELSGRYGLGDRGRELFGLLMGHVFNDRRGGFGGFVEGFREQGHGDLVSAWLGDPRSPRTIGAAEVGTVFGQGLLNDWGGRLGVSRATLAAAIAGVLPRLVAELTPGGRMPGGQDTVLPYESLARRDASMAQAPDVATPARDPPLHARDVDDPRTQERFDRRVEAAVPDTFGAIVPGDAVILNDGREVHDAPRPPVAALRREPRIESADAGREAEDTSRAYAPRARTEPAPPVDRASAMAAAFSDGRIEPSMRVQPDAASADPDPMQGIEFRQGPARKARRGMGGFGWLLLVVVVVGAAGWFAWREGLLDPYLAQVAPASFPAPSNQ